MIRAMENQYSTLQELLNSKIEEKRFTIDRLGQVTDIPRDYLRGILEGMYEDLPPRPYVRGYIVKLAEVLDLDEDLVLNMYRKESLRASGSLDRLPGNRFAIKKFRYRWIIVPIIILAILAYVIFFSRVSGTPYLQLSTPPTQEDPYVVNTPTIELEGKVEPGDAVFVDGEELAVGSDGGFSYIYNLQPELNTINFQVKRFLGKDISISRRVFYEKEILFDANGEAASTSAADLLEAGEGAVN
ncbi:MAG: hypothetical protein COU09_00425 [Candidatus Harrisonbacteria bacterium CG10_big_fil_rev_8_21_14_0_10_44_23]|uniref:HTH cro/C1-type domain-containing protein n=1 Tax=Candidatus Harrisonbacteria bacterium CG10_big_fil_rev_8_21_14_0_10_44_23 TaxID=1974585 RepID=A0A2H0UQW6_9BACT|nr:MAG: hypothetical protein COU09_00425 [Candidatus Harrisonbacteria bacterium CG10_big_fil_rev_8_21_14_0_10_44_23]